MSDIPTKTLRRHTPRKKTPIIKKNISKSCDIILLVDKSLNYRYGVR